MTRALNLHPEIICFHGPVPFKTVDPTNWSAYFEGARNIWLDEHCGWHPMPGKDLSSVRHWGNVHGLVPSHYDPATMSDRFRCVQVTRQPLERLVSMIERWIRVDYPADPSQLDSIYAATAGGLERAGLPYGPVETLVDKLFLCACGQTFPHDAVYLKRSDIPVYRSEDLSDVSTIEDLTSFVCGARWGSDELSKVSQIGRVDAQHKTITLSVRQLEFAQSLIVHFGLEEVYRSLYGN